MGSSFEKTMIKRCLVSLIFVVIVGTSYANPPEPRGQTKKCQNSLNQQNLQSLLNSIEDRLRNLDNVYSIQYSPNIEGRLAHFGRKLEGMEAKLTRLEALVSNEIEKLLENINGRNFKDDIANEHIIRKIDNAYERLSHRVVFTEGKMDMSEKKLESKLNMILTKLDKLEDSLIVRDTDMQEEISEVFSSVEEVKVQSDNILEKLDNITKRVKTLQDSPSARIAIIDDHRNVTNQFEQDVKKQFETLSNKMVNFHEYSWSTFNRIESYLRTIGLVTNQSRYEVQSGLRSLTIEVGRMAGNQHIIDNSKGREKLEELEKKLDGNFNNIMLAQNTFLESCYRVQKDEAQFESKIGEVLEKLLDTFSEKTAVEPKDIRRIEQILKNHDQYMRKSSVDTVKTVASLLQKDYNIEKKLDNAFSSITNSLESLQNSINEQSADDSFDEKLEDIITSLKDLQTLSIDINTNVKTTIRDVFPSFQEVKTLIENLRSQTKEDMIKENFVKLNNILEEIRKRTIMCVTEKLNVTEAEPKSPSIDNNRTGITFNESDDVANCLDLPIDARYAVNCVNITSIEPTTVANEVNGTAVDCSELIDIRSTVNCTNTSAPDENVTRNPNVERLISDIFLRNFTIPTSNDTIPNTNENNTTFLNVNDNNNLTTSNNDDIQAESNNLQIVTSTESIELSNVDENGK